MKTIDNFLELQNVNILSMEGYYDFGYNISMKTLNEKWKDTNVKIGKISTVIIFKLDDTFMGDIYIHGGKKQCSKLMFKSVGYEIIRHIIHQINKIYHDHKFDYHNLFIRDIRAELKLLCDVN